MHTNPSWKDYFVFSKKERNVFIILLFIFVSYCLFLALYTPRTEQPVIQNLDEQLKMLSSQNRTDADSANDENIFTDVATNTETANKSYKLFVFDPNTLDESGFRQLGLRDKTIRTIINYRSKGGRFRKPEDLRKIYGLQPNEADRLIPFVKIKSGFSQPDYAAKEYNNLSGNRITYNKPKPNIININTATVDEWKTLPAIGDVLSNRIVKYRDKIGGFRSIDQVKKTYGLSDSAFAAILPYLSSSSDKTEIPAVQEASDSKININTASLADFKNSSSIPVDVAEAIVIYRKQHGSYASIEDIKKIVFINDALYQKIAPYITVK